ncbi:UNVERIFIED_ORG: hypothetical protein GGE63_006032 [Rhizobium esperanzae]
MGGIHLQYTRRREPRLQRVNKLRPIFDQGEIGLADATGKQRPGEHAGARTELDDRPIQRGNFAGHDSGQGITRRRDRRHPKRVADPGAEKMQEIGACSLCGHDCSTCLKFN